MRFSFCFHTSQVLDWPPEGTFISQFVSLEVQNVSHCILSNSLEFSIGLSYYFCLCSGAREQNLIERGMSALSSASHPLYAVRESSFALCCSLLSLDM